MMDPLSNEGEDKIPTVMVVEACSIFQCQVLHWLYEVILQTLRHWLIGLLSEFLYQNPIIIIVDV